ncbi:MAG: SurA N-terminal domain-containing protein [Bacteroidales bacterium]|nr:SurA N-terminal domain-containing protein [Bacteroidales bacterium]
MAVLETIRVKFGILITVLIAVALLSFIIDPSTLQSVSASMSSKYDVGEIDGKSISYENFQAEVDKLTSISEMNGMPVHGDEAMAAIRNQAWNRFMDEYLFIPQANKAGFNVGNEEMYKMMSGEIMSPVLMQLFQGNMSKEMLIQFENQVNADQTGRMKMFWDNLLESVKAAQYYSKYESVLMKSNFTNSLMLTEQIKGNNNTFDVEFVMVPFGFAQDTTIVVSDKEIKEYYNKNKKYYKQNASRDIEYVVFEITPSAEDIAAANDAVARVYDSFAETGNMKSFLLANSDRPYDSNWYKDGELVRISRKVNDYAFSANASVSDVISDGNTFYGVRVMETAMVPDSVFISQIYLEGESASKADSLMDVVNARNFNSLASEFSAVYQEGADNQGMWILLNNAMTLPNFDMNAPFVMNDQNGKWLLLVTDKTAPVSKKRVAVLEKTAQASNKTRNDFYSKANTLATKSAGKYENFQKAVQEDGLYAYPVNNMAEGANNLNSISNTKEVSRWAFEAKKGDVSNIISVDNKYYIVAALKGIHEEGYTDIREVSNVIKNILNHQKLADKKTAEVAEKIEGLDDLQSIADALGTAVSTKDGMSFASFNSYGLDNIFIGAASVSEEGKICGPLKGSNGVYVYKVTGRDNGAFFTEDDAKNRNMQMSYYTMRMYRPVMEEAADVKNNIARFY